MKKFLNYLNSKKIVPKKKGHFYVIWVSKFIKFLNDKPVCENVDNDDINLFINKVSKTYKQWQVDQAAKAVQIYLFYKKNESKTLLIQSGNTDNQWKAVANEMLNMLGICNFYRRCNLPLCWRYQIGNARVNQWLRSRSPNSTRC